MRPSLANAVQTQISRDPIDPTEHGHIVSERSMFGDDARKYFLHGVARLVAVFQKDESAPIHHRTVLRVEAAERFEIDVVLAVIVA
jgi:hypothetical protein